MSLIVMLIVIDYEKVDLSSVFVCLIVGWLVCQPSDSKKLWIYFQEIFGRNQKHEKQQIPCLVHRHSRILWEFSLQR